MLTQMTNKYHYEHAFTMGYVLEESLALFKASPQDVEWEEVDNLLVQWLYDLWDGKFYLWDGTVPGIFLKMLQ